MAPLFRWQYRHATWVILAAILILGAAFRIATLGAESLWQDEIHTAVTAQKSTWTILTQPIENQQPLYFIIIHLWTRVAGEGEFAIRLPSAVLGVLLVAATFLLARRVSRNDALALGAALVAAVSPILIWYSREARAYTLMAVILMASTYVLLDYLERRRRRDLIIYGVLLALGLYTHFYFAPYAMVQGLIVTAWLVHRRRWADYGKWLGVTAAAGATLVFRIPVFMKYLDQLQYTEYSEASSVVWSRFSDGIGLVHPWLNDLQPAVFYTVWALALFAIAVSLLRRDRMLVVAALAVVPAALVLAGGALLGMPITNRYLIPTFPFWCILASHGMAVVFSWRPLARPVVVTPVALLAAVVTLGWGGITFAEESKVTLKEPWREVGHYVGSGAQPGDAVLVWPQHIARNVTYYTPQGLTPKPAFVSTSSPCEAGRRTWLVTHLKSGMGEAMAPLADSCRLVQSQDFLDRLAVYLFEPVPSGARPFRDDFACYGLTPTIVGTQGGDFILGTPGPDVIVGLGGNDAITGLNGDDVICAGASGGTINGSDGDDVLVAGSGTVVLNGGPGNDLVIGGTGEANLNGNDGDDTLFSASGNDRLNGGPGEDACTDRSDLRGRINCETAAPPSLPQRAVRKLGR